MALVVGLLTPRSSSCELARPCFLPSELGPPSLASGTDRGDRAPGWSGGRPVGGTRQLLNTASQGKFKEPCSKSSNFFRVAVNHDFVQLMCARLQRHRDPVRPPPQRFRPTSVGRVAAGARRLALKTSLQPQATRPAWHTGRNLCADVHARGYDQRRRLLQPFQRLFKLTRHTRPLAGDGAPDLQLLATLRPCVPFVRGTPLRSCACAIPQ